MHTYFKKVSNLAANKPKTTMFGEKRLRIMGTKT